MILYVNKENLGNSAAAARTRTVSTHLNAFSLSVTGSRVNQNRLLEFRATVESGQVGQEFRVRAATLWLKADILQRGPNKCRSTDIFVFKIISNRLPESVTLSSRVSTGESSQLSFSLCEEPYSAL